MSSPAQAAALRDSGKKAVHVKVRALPCCQALVRLLLFLRSARGERSSIFKKFYRFWYCGHWHCAWRVMKTPGDTEKEARERR